MPEHDGSVITSGWRLQHFKQAIQPVCGMTSKQIISELGGTALPGMPAEKKGTRQFLAPEIKKTKPVKEGFCSDVLEKMVWELKKREGLLKEGK